ncbi:MAG: hypothetical protein R3E96_16915 [Planctomycetota bacterium]
MALGSDDGFRLFLNGAQVAERRVDRGCSLDQDRAKLALQAGRNTLVLEVINTGGAAGFAFEAVALPRVQAQFLPLRSRALARPPPNGSRSWTPGAGAIPTRRAREATRNDLVAQRDTLNAAVPRTMVMRDRAMPREVSCSRVANTTTPTSSAQSPRTPPRWCRAPRPGPHPPRPRALVVRPGQPARGAWRSTDFGSRSSARPGGPSATGFQGVAEPPELLDWLAVEFVESGLTAAPAVADCEQPHLSAVGPRRAPPPSKPTPTIRASPPSAPAARRGAPARPGLYAAGLLDESFGGPSVKPYQPKASGARWPCPPPTRASSSAAWTATCIAAASTRTGNAPVRRRR